MISALYLGSQMDVFRDCALARVNDFLLEKILAHSTFRLSAGKDQIFS